MHLKWCSEWDELASYLVGGSWKLLSNRGSGVLVVHWVRGTWGRNEASETKKLFAKTLRYKSAKHSMFSQRKVSSWVGADSMLRFYTSTWSAVFYNFHMRSIISIVQIRPSTYMGDQSLSLSGLQEPWNSESIAPHFIEFSKAPNGPVGWSTEVMFVTIVTIITIYVQLFVRGSCYSEISKRKWNCDILLPSALAFGLCFDSTISTMPPNLYPIEKIKAFFNAIQRSPLVHVPHKM